MRVIYSDFWILNPDFWIYANFFLAFLLRFVKIQVLEKKRTGF